MTNNAHKSRESLSNVGLPSSTTVQSGFPYKINTRTYKIREELDEQTVDESLSVISSHHSG